MLKINLFGKELECQKAKYQDNNRLAVILVDPKTKELYTFITINLPDALLFGELVDIENNYESFIDHQPGKNYQQFIQELINTNIVDDEVVSEGHSGFNHYIALRFKDECVNQMDESCWYA